MEFSFAYTVSWSGEWKGGDGAVEESSIGPRS